MRLLEIKQAILAEASAADSKYPPGFAFILSSGNSKSKEKFLAAANTLNLNLEDEITKQAGNQPIEGSHIVIGNGGNIVVFTDSNNRRFSTDATGPTYRELLVKPGANRGEVAEGILGAAMFAKFIARKANGEIGAVTQGDVWKVLRGLKQSGSDEYSVTVEDANHEYADKISFVLRLKAAPYRALTGGGSGEGYEDLVSSTVAYVNDGHVDRYSKYFYVNGRPDVIKVISDGVSGETERKTDVDLQILDHKTGQLRNSRLSISLKAGPVKQFGQVGGNTFESMQTLFGAFGVKGVEVMRSHFEEMYQEDPIKALRQMYSQMTRYFAGEVEGANNREEYKFVNQVAQAIAYFATKGDPGVSLVQLDKGTYKILRFSNLERKLDTIDLTAEYSVGSSGYPTITIRDINTPGTKGHLIYIRAKKESKKDGSAYTRNLIEKGHLLTDLTSTAK